MGRDCRRRTGMGGAKLPPSRSIEQVIEEMERLAKGFDGTKQLEPQLVEIHDLQAWIKLLKGEEDER